MEKTKEGLQMAVDTFEHEEELHDRPQIGKKEQLIEVGVFLFLIVPSLTFSFFPAAEGNIGFVLTAVATILRDLALLSLVLFFLWRNRERLRAIGWTSRQVWREIAWGVGLFIPVFFGAAYLESLLKSAGLSTPARPLPSLQAPDKAGDIALAILLVLVVAVAEESIFRGYLILRFERISQSVALAVVLSAFIFSLGHGYEGSAGVVTVGTIGLVFALVYRWRNSLVAPMTMHFLQDFLAIVLLPLLGLG
jgi:membrane protease YdiL (CAAX protease family)